MAIHSYIKDPDEILDYTVDWSLWLNGDTIASDSWTVAGGITSVLQSNTDTVSVIWLSGGTINTSYTAACKIVTAAGRTAERTLTIFVVAR